VTAFVIQKEMMMMTQSWIVSYLRLAEQTSVRSLFSILLMVCCAGSVQAGGGAVVGYYPDWNRGSYPSNLIAYQNLTHIAHAFLIPNSDGSLDGVSGFAYPEMVQAAHQAGVKVILVLGGWGGSAGFPGMAADTASRHRFIENLKGFCQTNSYDGVDLDWEYPANATERGNLTLLVHELRQAFAGVNPPLSVSLAIPGGEWSGRWFDVGQMNNDVDWFGVMTYDYYGSWTSTSGPNSPVYGTSLNTQGCMDEAVSYYVSTRALPANKIMIGIPFYGWVFNSSTMYGPSTGASQKTYASIMPNLTQGWTRYWDDVGQVPYMINPGATQVISYDDTMSVRIKCAYAASKGVQGAIIWAIGQDYLNSEQPLLNVIGREFGLVSDVLPPADAGLPTDYGLEQNYPNPFNPTTVVTYELPAASDVKLVVYDLLGREVAVLVNERKAPGNYEVQFNASGLSSGVFLYRLTAGDFGQTRKMALVK
jgi:chitinase